jgi:hypothetical protein
MVSTPVPDGADADADIARLSPCGFSPVIPDVFSLSCCAALVVVRGGDSEPEDRRQRKRIQS